MPGNHRTLMTSSMETMDIKGKIGPNARIICDLGEEDDKGCYSVLINGIGGNFISPFYDNQQKMFIEGKYAEMKAGLRENKYPYITNIRAK